MRNLPKEKKPARKVPAFYNQMATAQETRPCRQTPHAPTDKHGRRRLTRFLPVTYCFFLLAGLPQQHRSAPSRMVPAGGRGICGMKHLRLSIRAEFRPTKTPCRGIMMCCNSAVALSPTLADAIKTRACPSGRVGLLPSHPAFARPDAFLLLLIPTQTISHGRHVSPAETRICR